MPHRNSSAAASFTWQCCTDSPHGPPAWLVRGSVGLALLLLILIPLSKRYLSQVPTLRQFDHQLRAEGELPPFMLANPPGLDVLAP